MKPNKELVSELMVGIFVATIFIGLFVFTIVISGKNLFRKDVFGIECVMPDAMGLRRNDPVIARGTTVGIVTDVHYERDGVHVAAQLEAPVEFHEGYEITVVSTSILGGRQLVLAEGDMGTPVVEDVHHLVGKNPSDLMEDAAAAVARVRAFLETDALDNFEQFSESIKAIGVRVENGEGTLGRLLSTNDEVYVEIRTAVADFREIADRLEKGEGTLGRLLSEDDAMYQSLYASITNINTISDRLVAGQGTLGHLLSEDDAMYNDLRDSIANIREVSDRLKNGEGTLGKLFAEDGLYDNVNGTITDARELLDDFREANTLSTVSSILMSGF